MQIFKGSHFREHDEIRCEIVITKFVGFDSFWDIDISDSILWIPFVIYQFILIFSYYLKHSVILRIILWIENVKLQQINGNLERNTIFFSIFFT